MKTAFSLLGMGLSMAATVIYIIGVFRGRGRPERITWLLWTVLGIIYLLAAVRTGGNVIYTCATFVGPLIILLLSLKWGVGGRSTLDLVSLGVAGIALVLLFFTTHPIISLALSIFVDAIGALLTVRKLFIDRSSEPKLNWLLSALGGGCAVAGLQNYRFENVLFPAYIFCIGMFIFLLAKPAPPKASADRTKLERL